MLETKEALVEEFRRETILKAARHVMARRGLAGASMQAIADEAGLAKGTLYLYFKDRDELLEQAAGHVLDELLARVKGVLRPERPLRDGLRDLVRTNLEFFDAQQDFLRVYVEVRTPEGGACRRRARPQYVRYVELLADHIAGAMRRGEARPVDPARAAAFVAEGMSAVLLQRLQERGRIAPAEDAEWIVDLVVDGLCARTR